MPNTMTLKSTKDYFGLNKSPTEEEVTPS